MTPPTPDRDERKAESISGLPSALGRVTELLGRLPGAPAVFCDYDGTLSPIVEDPDRAVLGDPMRAALVRLADLAPLAVVSGRDVADVREKVAIDGIAYAGSHGLDLIDPSGERTAHPEAEDFLPSLETAQEELSREVRTIPGCHLERKRFALAVHYRRVAPELHDAVRGVVEAVGADHPDLRPSGGKMVLELRPAIDWDKGRAVLHLLEALHLAEADATPIYIGDDLTDEDAFRALPPAGIGIVVEGADHPTAADYRLPDTDAVRGFLERLAAHLEGDAPQA